MTDIYEPLERYRDEFCAKHAENTAALFDSLVRKSGLDVEANRRTVAQAKALQKQLDAHASTRNRLNLFKGLLITAVSVAGLALLFSLYQIWAEGESLLSPQALVIAFLVLVGGLSLIFSVCVPKLRVLEQKIQDLSARHGQTIRLAWQQITPLLQLFDWSQPTALIQKTVPRLEFDPYFSVGRLNDLVRLFGWDGSFSKKRSVIFSHSGEINGNPFVLAHTRSMKWGTKTYHGERTITWTESFRDSNGKRQTRVRTQTLHASVTKPFPEFPTESVLIYGNEAAPTLRFSRTPSALSGTDNSFFNRQRKKRVIKKLEAYSRNLTDDSNYTIMANRDFEALFHATDRSDEVQFRLLFTPLAQSQMLLLLNDRSVGFGDDFSFTKRNRINFIQPKHLQSANIHTDPSQFNHYDYDSVRSAFLSFNSNFFHNLYFALAPLLAIPLYQQTRTHQSIYQRPDDKRSSFWEHEAIANFLGNSYFKHPNCATECILKTSASIDADGTQLVQVTAHGFSGTKRTDHVSVWGGDGRPHDVPVHWTEYLPVQHTTPLSVTETNIPSLQDYQQQLASSPSSFPWDPTSIPSAFRRSCLAAFRSKK